MNKITFLFLLLAVLFGLQFAGCAWHDRDYMGGGYQDRESVDKRHKYDNYGRDERGFPRGFEQD